MSRLAPARALLVLCLTACASGGASKETVSPVKALPPDAAPPVVNDGLPTGFKDAFAAADARARAIVYHQECTATVTRLRGTGTFGAAATAPKTVFCERTADGVPIGGVFDIDSAFSKPRRLTVVRLDGARPRYTDALDTARIAVQAKLVRDINRDISAGWKLLKRPFFISPIVAPNGAVEAWAMPLATKAKSTVTGGEIGFVRAETGGLTRTVDHLATWKLVAIPATGPIKLVSAERDVAAVADLAAARALADLGRTVTVNTTAVTSTLVAGLDPATGARKVWEHGKLTP